MSARPLRFVVLLLLGGGCASGGVDTLAKSDTGPGPDTAAWCVPTEDLDGVGKDGDCDGYASDGYVGGTDCDDADAAVHPGAEELCDGRDNDCDGAVEDEELYLPWYPDADGDGYGSGAAVYACEAPEGYASVAGDCDDADAARAPGEVDLCDGVDAACNGLGREVDADADGQLVCAGDCDDADPTAWLGAAELCDGRDDDCDGEVPADEVDVDGDGWSACAGDCDDADAGVSPGAVDRCGDAIDADCDGAVVAACDAACTFTVPGDAATIQGAIDAALDGDVVCVEAGTYAENLDFGGAEITVAGVHGAALTVIDGGAVDAVVRFASGEGPAATLSGFTLTNGEGWYGGGGVYVQGASPTLTDLVVSGNQGGWDAGGIYVEAGDPAIVRVEVTGNEAYAWYCAASYGDGGGIGLHGSNAVLEDVYVHDNVAGGVGGGLYLESSPAVLANVTVSANYAGLSGGGLYLWDSPAALTHVRIIDNSTDTYWGLGTDPYGGGMTLFEADPTLSHVAIVGNTDERGAGAVSMYNSDPTLVDTVVTGNSTGFSATGGAPSLTYCDVWDNGGADYAGMADPTGADGNLSVDPLLLAGGQLDAASPLVDAGDPAGTDPDGSRADIGPFGGAGAASWDADGDGWPAWWLPGPYDAATSPAADCDDADATVSPGSGC